MIVLPDVRGLHHFYEELALRFAEAGIDAIAIDYFGRTAGIGDRGEGFDYQPHVAQLTWDGDARRRAGRAARAPARARRSRRCSASASAWAAGCRSRSASVPELELAGVDRLLRLAGRRAPQRLAVPGRRCAPDDPRARCWASSAAPTRASAPDAVAAFERSAGQAAGVDHKMITYPDAPHSFFDRKQAEFADASTAAWGEVLTFVKAHTPAA